MSKHLKTIFNFITRKKPTIPVLKLTGIIASGGFSRGRINSENLENNIKKAFSDSNAKAVALIVNSPGGSPVQSSLIYKRIRYFADKREIPIIVFVEDVAASGGYWLACAGDEIFADYSSIIGSIGVISASFGFVDAMKKIGIERRVYTSVKSKGSLDPFKPENPNDVKILKKIQTNIHEIFVNHVKSRRGAKLNIENKEIFSGAFWSAEDALKLGLIDGIGELREILRSRFGKDIRIKVIENKKGFLSNLTQTFSDAFLSLLVEKYENKSFWSKFGK